MDNQWLKVEKLCGKRKIAHHEQCLLLSQCFKSRLLLLRQNASGGGKGLIKEPLPACKHLHVNGNIGQYISLSISLCMKALAATELTKETCNLCPWLFIRISIVKACFDCVLHLFHQCSVISQLFLSKERVILVHLCWHQRVSRKAHPTAMSAKEGNPSLYVLKHLVWPGRGSTPRPHALPLNYLGGHCLSIKGFVCVWLNWS